MKRSPTIVLYHDISDGTNPLLDKLNVSTRPEAFQRHIEYFNRNYDLISISDLVSEKLPKKPLLITFDDAYRSVIDVGGPILKEFDTPSLFFINPSPIKERAIPIDNLICLACNTIGYNATFKIIGPNESAPPNGESIAHLIGTLLPRLPLNDRNQLKDTLLRALSTSNEQLITKHPIYLEDRDFKRMESLKMDVGNHSYSHTHMRILDQAGRKREIRDSKDALDSLTLKPVNTLSVPYGDSKDAPQAVLTSARESGHKLTFLVHERLNVLRPAPDVYFRVSLHNDSTQSLPLKLKFLPALRTIKSLIKRK